MSIRSRGLAALSAVALAVAVAGCGGASTGPGTAPEEGLRVEVHGDWVIDVLDADGTLAAHHEFSNALVPAGARAITRLLTGEALPDSPWAIQLSGPGMATTTIEEGDGLTVTDSAGTLTFEADYEATSTGLVASVSTRLLPVDEWGIFTLRDVDPAIEVQDGQTAQVRVTITFSS